MLPLAIAGTSCVGGFAAKNFHDGFQAFVKIYFKNQPIYNCTGLILFTASTALWADILNIKFLNPYAFNIYPSYCAVSDISQSLRGVDNDFTDLKRAQGNKVYYFVITLVALALIMNLYATFREAGLV